MVAAKLANIKNSDFVCNQHSANLQSPEQISRAEAANLLNVSERTVNSAKKVEQNGSPELIEQVESGNVSVSVVKIQQSINSANCGIIPEGQLRPLARHRPLRFMPSKPKTAK